MNYNVKYFLEQCLYSVEKSSAGLDVETIVVDNHSTDGSLDYLRPRFPGVQFIGSCCNAGFAKACNLGLQQASGGLILFLNPDTILAEDCFEQCIQFFETHEDGGALGVRMIDGAGRFLRESKRSFPSPLTSMFKLFGLAALFPKSKLFGRYHLGFLDGKKDHAVDVLAGAFMMVRKNVLDKTGGFDEAFFMYGEDIDLSYRIQQAGYSNYYFAGTTIIHFKGESTRRGSIDYVKMFYKAMNVFVQKHYGGSRAFFFNAFLHLAIWIRASISAAGKMLKRLGLPVVDALLILFSFWVVKEVWSSFIRPEVMYSNQLLLISFPAFTAFYLGVAYYAGLYDRYYRTANLIRSTAIATISLLAIYALLPERFRFSRAIVVFGAGVAFLLIALVRMLLMRSGFLLRSADQISKPYILIAGDQAEYQRAADLLAQRNLSEKIIGRISVNGNGLAELETAANRAAALKAEEIVLCAGQLRYQQMIAATEKLSGLRLRFFAGNSIVGSDDSTSRGETLAKEKEFALARATNRRIKRLIDVVLSVIGILFFPLHFLFVKRPVHFIGNCLRVIQGRCTWAGYIHGAASLPRLRPGVLAPNGMSQTEAQNLPEETAHLIDHLFARDYDPLQDLSAIIKNYRYLGA